MAFGPNITSYTITFINRSPTNRTIVSWYKEGSIVLEETIITNSTTNKGSASLPVSMRNDRGRYRVVVETDFNDQLPYVPQSILSVTVADYSFDIDVIGKGKYVLFQIFISFLCTFLVFPSHPEISATPSSFNSTIHWTHTNQSLDDLPQSIKLVLLLGGAPLQSVNISTDQSINSFTFINLIPATQYSVRLSVANIDRISSSPQLTNFTTLPSGK